MDSNSVVYGSVANKLSFCYFPRLLFRATPRHNPIRNPILFNRLSIRPLTHCHGLALQRQRSQGRLCLASSLSGSHLLGLYLVGPMKIFWKGCLRSIQSSFWTMKETWPPCLPSITITDRSCSYFFLISFSICLSIASKYFALLQVNNLSHSAKHRHHIKVEAEEILFKAFMHLCKILALND